LLATACGYTVEEIDRVTMSEFTMLSKYWVDHPPVHLMVAGYLGIKPKAKQSDDKATLDMLKAHPGFRMH
jgi:hypothetical protein